MNSMAKKIFRPIDVPWGSNEPLMVIPRVVKVQEPGLNIKIPFVQKKHIMTTKERTVKFA